MNRRIFGKTLFAAAFSFGLSNRSQGYTMEAFQQKNYPRKIIRPKRLKKGDTIGLVAPSSPISDERLEKTIQNIQGMGFKLKFNRPAVLAQNGYLAGSDLLRAKEVNQMFADPEVDGIWCIRGGYGAARILPLLNYRTIRKNPKVIIGYSDITALLQGIFLNTGLVGFHGPSGASEFTDYTTEHVQNILTQPSESYKIHLSAENQKMENPQYENYVIQEGKARGPLIGGNLTLISSLIGTPYELDFDDKILFLEDIGERPYRIDRMLTQLLFAKKLQNVKGIVLGVFHDCEAKEGENSLTLSETLKDRLARLKVPIAYGYSFGHIDNQFTLPIGIEAEMNTDDFTITLLEAAVD